MASTEGLAELVAGIRGDHEGAGVAFCARYQAGVRYFVRHRLGKGSDREDCVQEILLGALQGIRSGLLREPERLSGFVHSIAVNTVAQFIKQRVADRVHGARGERTYPDTWWVSDCGLDPEAQALHREQVRIVEGVIAQLPPRYREILVRAYLKEQDHEQIGKEMHLSDGQVRLVKLRARRKVQERLRLNRGRSLAARKGIVVNGNNG